MRGSMRERGVGKDGERERAQGRSERVGPNTTNPVPRRFFVAAAESPGVLLMYERMNMKGQVGLPPFFLLPLPASSFPSTCLFLPSCPPVMTVLSPFFLPSFFPSQVWGIQVQHAVIARDEEDAARLSINSSEGA